MNENPRARGLIGVKTKLFGLILGTAVIALLSACLAFVLYDRASYRAAKSATLTVLADAVADGAFGPVAFEDPESAKYVLRTIGSEGTALGAAIYLKSGARLAMWEREGVTSGLGEKRVASAEKPGLLRISRPIQKDGNAVGDLEVVFSTKDIDARTAQFVRLAGAVLLGAIFLATLVVLVSHRVFTVPVKRLADAAHLVQSENRFDVRVERSSNDELGVLTSAFNSMLEAVQTRDQELAHHREHLEHLVEARTADLDRRNQSMRLVLDTVDQGLVTLDLAGKLDSERSRVFGEWFKGDASATLGQLLDERSPGFGIQFEMTYEQLAEGFLPLDVCLGQLPRRMSSTDGREFSLDYRPIVSGETLEKVLVILSDVTDHVARERAAKEQRQVIAMFEQITRDRAGFVEFLTDADRMVKGLALGKFADRAEMLRVLHTLKGNCGLFEITGVSDLCHELEERAKETGDALGKEDTHRLEEAWRAVADRAAQLLGEVKDSLVIDLGDYDELVRAAHAASPGSQLERMIQRLAHEPVGPRLRKMGEQSTRLAERLGIGKLAVSIDAEGVRLPPNYGWLWALVPHLLRNALDHGLAERSTLTSPLLSLGVRYTERQLEIEIGDNGRGIDWERVRVAAKNKGIPHESREDLARALFADEVSTKETASEISGRGIGMAAVYADVKAHGGRIEVMSKLGSGTVFKIVVPHKPEGPIRTRASIQARSLLPANFGVANDQSGSARVS